MTDPGVLLIANRGEIAVRIIRTARAMGLRTVAIFSDADRGTAHVRLADEAIPVPGYLDVDAVIDAAIRSGATAVHPGYGFLSENVGFATRCEDAGISFVGPTPANLAIFGAKHTARDAAEAAGVPLLAGTGVLGDLDEALAAAGRIGYPVMLKATAGGGGIGMRACADDDALRAAWTEVRRLAEASFGSAEVFLERLVTAARHVEVQVFGDGTGRVRAIGDRDCTLQRRNQKVLEECPAPGLPETVRTAMAEASVRLCAAVGYRSAGTVEYIYDADREEFAFLEVNTRLQVEHPVTEAVYGIDLVAWMLRLSAGETDMMAVPLVPRGAAVEARVYAENTDLGNVPSAGVITRVQVPDDVRFDAWIEPGAEVSAHYDPMLGKLIVTGTDRDAAWAALREALAATRIDGVATNLGLLAATAGHPVVLAGEHHTGTLATVVNTAPRIEVVRAGLLATVQDWPGRIGYWPVGIPPSGPMDDLSFRLGNVALGNPEGAPGIEITMTGPVLRFHTAATVMLTGAPTPFSVDDVAVPQWEPVAVPAGSLVTIGTASRGMRSYLLIQGSLDVPSTLGSASTFDLGEIGGYSGRALRVGDVLALAGPVDQQAVPVSDIPDISETWDIAALEGPHAAPEFFTPEDMETFYATGFEVHYNSSRTGVRLIGPAPSWAREDGGEAGLHPSNIHDTPYAVGAVDYTGDLPILLGPDGPSLGGFTCPATVASGHLWKLGQLRPGDTVRFVPVSPETASALTPAGPVAADRPAVHDRGILHRDGDLTIRRSGDRNILVEYGAMVLDLVTRMRVHALMLRLQDTALAEVIELTPGIRSLQVHFTPGAAETVIAAVLAADAELGDDDELTVPSRTVHLPLAWDDPSTREAIRRYMAGVRDDAPWCPWNIEFIRRINGLDSVDDVYRTVFDASYLVLGLGDVYLGAPVATPIDPRHRLVTTKYNPARTWTPQNAVGIGGSYLCIYGMEGPGGYQFVGRTVQVWATHAQRGPFEEGVPWLLRFFDRIRWYPVEPGELLTMRADMAAGRLPLRIEEGTFSLAEHRAFLAENAGEIADFRRRQGAAFGDERSAWAAAGEFDRTHEAPAPESSGPAVEVPEGSAAVEAQFVSSVFRIDVAEGDLVTEGQTLLAVEAMKMESAVVAPRAGRISALPVAVGTQVAPGAVLAVIA
ncbi:urea carboxylase [Actinoplanes sp. NBRC 101535]|uniref:urea carboxylase n=1 Tax=Actinoplanes sp. NBRC 101535 TaxID=3032196 RepID=UPI0024A4D6BE|nr:urea carboxylase [Actinoplanes sp. NBRC 101535]GLY03131.1 urea carboxylase [Actinoplanes sp. NBRC 101535]